MERAQSFGSIAEDYDRLRPSPPTAAISWLLPANAREVVDLAAGTGLMTRALVSAGVRVTAVEPDDRMRAVLTSRSPEVTAVAGVGEAMPLASASADAVVVSSAWHWMDPVLAVPEIARVLRPGGRFGVIWTSRDYTVGWVRRLEVARHGGKPEHTFVERRQHREVVLPDPSLWSEPETAEFTSSREMTIEDLVGMYATYSQNIVAADDERAVAQERSRTAALELFGDAATVEVPIRSRCWRAELRPRGAGR